MSTLTVEEKEAARQANLQKKRDAEKKRRERIKKEKEAAQSAQSNGGDDQAKTEPPKREAPAERRRTPKDPEATAVMDAAKALAPGIKSPYQAFEIRSLMTIVGRRDPIEFAFAASASVRDQLPEVRPDREVLLAWARGELPKEDPAAALIRARAREIAAHPEGKNLWGRKIAAVLVAISDSRS